MHVPCGTTQVTSFICKNAALTLQIVVQTTDTIEGFGL